MPPSGHEALFKTNWQGTLDRWRGPGLHEAWLRRTMGEAWFDADGKLLGSVFENADGSKTLRPLTRDMAAGRPERLGAGLLAPPDEHP